MKQLFFLSFFIFSFACSNSIKNKNENAGELEEAQLHFVDTLMFPLDSVTPPITTMSQKFKQYYSFLSYGKNKAIHLYNIKDNTLYKTINLEKIPDDISAYLIHSFDSIFLYSYAQKSISLIDSNISVLKEWKLPKFSLNSKISPFIITGRPLLFKDSVIYSGGLGTGEPPVGQKLFVSINLKNNKIGRSIEYPDIYSEGNWGGSYFRYIYYTTSLTNKLLISYPASHNVFESQNFEDLNKIYAGSGMIKSISSMNGMLTTTQRTKHFHSNYSYRSIITDSYREVYYRIYEKPIDYKESPPWYKPCGVIILDKNQNYIGEVELNIENISPNWHYSTFVNESGLCIQLNDESEDYLKFVVVKFTYNETN